MRNRTTDVVAVLTDAFERGIRALTGAQGERSVPTVMMGHLVFLAEPGEGGRRVDHRLAG